MAHSKTSIDMTSGNIWKQIAAFALPVLLGEVFQLSYLLVDSAIVGNFIGDRALAAVGASETMTRVIVGFFNGVAVGCTVIAARAFGRKDMDVLRNTVRTIIYLSLGLGILLGILGFSFSGILISLMKVPADTAPLAKAYLRIYFAGVVGLILYNSVSGILRAVGDSKRPLYFLIMSSLLNIGLDVLFVAVLKAGVQGAAFATILSQAIAAVFSLTLLMRTEEPWRFLPKGQMDRAAVHDIITIGIPIGLQKSIVSLSNVIVLSHISFFGTACLAGWVVYTKMSHVLTMTVQSLTTAVTTFVGQNNGARNYRRTQEGVRVTLLECLSVVIILIAGVILFRKPVIRFFGDSAEMYRFAEQFVCWLIPFQVLHAFMSVYIGTLRGCGKAAATTVYMLTGLVAARQLYLLIVVRVLNTPVSVGLAYPLGWLVSGLMGFVYYQSHKEKDLFGQRSS